MWEFFDRLVSVSLPRVRDFKGVSPKAFDGRGNYSLGIREQIIFLEVDYDSVERITGMNITMVTSAKTDSEGKSLLAHLGVPFRGARERPPGIANHRRAQALGCELAADVGKDMLLKEVEEHAAERVPGPRTPAGGDDFSQPRCRSPGVRVHVA